MGNVHPPLIFPVFIPLRRAAIRTRSKSISHVEPARPIMAFYSEIPFNSGMGRMGLDGICAARGSHSTHMT